MPDAHPPALDRAIAAVPAEHFHGTDGRAVRPCTPADVTHRHLRMLDVQPGANVLDVGLGSGLSAALLAQLAGPRGQVTAVEIEPDLAERAEKLYTEHGHHVTVHLGDGLLGHPPSAPYDRILVGATPPAIPDTWLRQLKPGGVLLSGVRLADLPGAYAIARITVDDHHRPHEVDVHHGGYTPMLAPTPSKPVTRSVDPHTPEHSLTVVGDSNPRTAAGFLTALTDDPHIEATPAPGNDYFHVKNWLVATSPDGLLEATTKQGTGVGLGLVVDDTPSHVAVATDDCLVADSANSPALEALHRIVGGWQQVGRPRTHELRARLVSAEDAWHVRLSDERKTG